MSAYTIAWIAWGALFAVVEIVAVRNETEGDTLSEHVWKIVKLRSPDGKARWRRLGLLAFMVWLTGHFTVGW